MKMSTIPCFNETTTSTTENLLFQVICLRVHRQHKRCNLDYLIRVTRQLSQFSFDWVSGVFFVDCIHFLEIPNRWPIFWCFHNGNTLNRIFQYSHDTTMRMRLPNQSKIVSYAWRIIMKIIMTFTFSQRVVYESESHYERFTGNYTAINVVHRLHFQVSFDNFNGIHSLSYRKHQTRRIQK